MRKILIVLALFFSVGAFSQNIRLNTYALYAFDDKVDSYYSNTSYYNGKVKGGLIWGGGLEFMAQPELGVELSYLRQDAKAPINYYSSRPPAGVRTDEFDLGVDYILVGANRYHKFSDNFEGYGGGQMGAAFARVTRPANAVAGEVSDNATKFSWGLRLGANIWPGGSNSKLGLKLQTGIMSAVQSVGGGLYFGTGGGGAGITSYSSFLQFNIGGGLIFQFSK